MFHSIKLIKSEPVTGNKLRAIFQIKDTCFAEEIELIGPQTETSCYEPIAIFKVYAKRSLNIVRNLAIYYLTTTDGSKYIVTDAEFFERWFPTLNYRRSYSKIVRIYFDDLSQMIDEYNREEQLIAQTLKKIQS